MKSRDRGVCAWVVARGTARSGRLCAVALVRAGRHRVVWVRPWRVPVHLRAASRATVWRVCSTLSRSRRASPADGRETRGLGLRLRGGGPCRFDFCRAQHAVPSPKVPCARANREERRPKGIFLSALESSVAAGGADPRSGPAVRLQRCPSLRARAQPRGPRPASRARDQGDPTACHRGAGLHLASSPQRMKSEPECGVTAEFRGHGRHTRGLGLHWAPEAAPLKSLMIKRERM